MYLSELSQSAKGQQLMFPPEFIIDERKKKKRKMVERNNGNSEQQSPSYVSILKTYCQETSLHGFKYFVRPRGTQTERIFWVVQLVIVYLLGATALWNQLLYFYNTPVLISFQPNPTLVSSIPLPAVTLCPDMQVRKSFFNLSREIAKNKIFTKKERDIMYLTTTMCDIAFENRVSSIDFSPKAIEEFSLAHNSYNRCKDFVVEAECQWKRIEDPCLYFQPTFSPQGACMSFNLLPPDQLVRYTGDSHFFDNPFNGREVVWNVEEGYTEGRKRSRPSADGSPPWSSTDTSLSTYYLFLLKVPTQLFDPICFGGKGFHGYLHNPAELPTNSHTSFYVKPGNQLNLQIKPELFTIEDQLKSWDPESKKCYMQSERQLKFFKIYTRINCEIECESNFTQQKCGCATFFQPRYNNTLVCGPGVDDCLSQYSETTDPTSIMEERT